jgi:hypothetical protein
MAKSRDWERIYEDCQSFGVSAVARSLGMTYQRLVAELHRAGCGGEPSRREIAEACLELQRGWSESRKQSRLDAARS